MGSLGPFLSTPSNISTLSGPRAITIGSEVTQSQDVIILLFLTYIQHSPDIHTFYCTSGLISDSESHLEAWSAQLLGGAKPQ
jgi:hypothetical protein